MPVQTSQAPMFVARRVRWPVVALAVVGLLVVTGLAVLLAVEVGWEALSLIIVLLWVGGLVIVPLLSVAVDGLVLDVHGVTRMGPGTVRSHVPWSRVRRLEVAGAAGRPALACNVGVQPQPGATGRVDAFPLTDAQAASVMGVASQAAQHADPGWLGRPGAAVAGSSMKAVSAGAHRWWAAACLAVAVLVCGACLVLGAHRVHGSTGRIITQFMGWVVLALGLLCAVCVPWLLTVGVEVSPRGIRASAGRRLSVPGAISMTWAQVLDLSVTTLPLAMPRSDGRGVRRPVLCVRWNTGRAERIAVLRLPPEQCQQVADLLHAYRPDLI